MTEINNIHNFGYSQENNRPKQNKEVIRTPEAEEHARSVVQDLGVLGRSQVRSTKAGDISKSVDEAVALAINNPALLEACDDLYETVYQNKIKEGMSECDAHDFAMNAEAELLDIVASRGY